MSLDIEEIIDGWERPDAGSLAARIVPGMHGEEQVQLRVDLGMLQMFPDGRPDGGRYRGFAGVVEFITHETRLHGGIGAEAWQEVERELQQYNYRRLAFTSLAEGSIQRQDTKSAAIHLRRAVRDIDQCLYVLRTFEERQGGIPGPHAALIPSLLFNRAKLISKLRLAQERFEEAVEALEAGCGALDDILSRLGFEDDARRHDPGLTYLRQAAQKLRDKYAVKRTLRQSLAEAIAEEDFQLAVRLRDQLKQREQTSEFKLDWPPPSND